MITNPELQPWLRARVALPSQPELIEIAAAADQSQSEGSKVGAWLALPAIQGLDARLSASAVETYETCPLQFKFEREWKLSRQGHAALQYGAAGPPGLRNFFHPVPLGPKQGQEEFL